VERTGVKEWLPLPMLMVCLHQIDRATSLAELDAIETESRSRYDRGLGEVMASIVARRREIVTAPPSVVDDAPPELVDLWVSYVSDMPLGMLDSFERRIFSGWFPESLGRLRDAIADRRRALTTSVRRESAS